MAYKQNIYTRPYIAVLRRGGMEIEAVFWAESERELRARLKEELSEKTEIVRIKERGAE